MNKKIHIPQRTKLTSVCVSGLLICLLCVLTTGAFAATAREIDTSADVAFERFNKQVKGAKEFAKTAKGLLILPNVKKAGLIVGGQFGEGALRVGGKTVDYYNIVSASVGLQIGAQSKDIIIAFMTKDALSKFRAGKGWEVGVDGNIALIKVGAGRSIDTTTIKDPIVAFVFDVKGLMADVSLAGSKFTKLDKKK